MNVSGRVPELPSSAPESEMPTFNGDGGGVPSSSGSWIFRNTWSAVAAELLVETRIWHARLMGKPLFSAGSFGDWQLKMPCGLAPLNGWNAWLGSLVGNETFPLPSATTAAGEVPRSQFTVGSQPTAVGRSAVALLDVDVRRAARSRSP